MKKIFVVAALIGSSPAFAQTSADTLDNVTVTASKFSTKTTETGKVVITINRQQIEKAGSRDLSQVITELGGVFINGYSSNTGKDKNIYLRGGRVEHTLITIDGVPVYDASGIGSNFDIRNIPVDIVDRVEILKGSQSTLYGSDAIAGVINIITRKGGNKPFAVSGTAHYGSYDTKRANIAVNGAVKKVDYNVGYSHLSTDGISEAQRPFNATAAFENDKYTQNNVQASVGVQATSALRFQPFIRYNKNKGGIDNGAFIDELDYNYEVSNLQTGMRSILSLGKAQLNVIYQYNGTERSFLDDSTQSRNGYYVYNQSAYDAREHFAEAFMVYPFSNFKLTVGTDFRRSAYDFNSLNVSPASPPFAPTQTISRSALSGDSIKQHQNGVYAALNYTRSGFSVEGGARYNNHSEYGSNFAFNINPSYLLNRTVKLFANISSGYRTPSLYQLFSEYGNQALQPEKSLNLEGGAQVFSTDGRAALRATYFNRRVNDLMFFFTNPTTFASQYINQDKQKDYGIEVDGSLNLTERIQAKVFYTYVNGNISTRTANKDTAFFNLLRRPKHSVQLQLGSQITKALYASLQLNNIGERRDVYFNPSNFRSEPIVLKPYTLVNFYTEYGFGKLKVFADLRNVFDESYTDIYGYSNMGFNAYGGVRFRF